MLFLMTHTFLCGLILPGDKYSEFGVTFTDSFQESDTFAINLREGLKDGETFADIVATTGSGPTFLEMDFDTTVTDVSFETGAGPGGYTIEAFDASGNTVLITTAPSVGFVLLGNAEFMRLRVQTTLDAAIQLDNLSFTTVPEPAMVTMLGFGCVTLLRRRKA